MEVQKTVNKQRSTHMRKKNRKIRLVVWAKRISCAPDYVTQLIWLKISNTRIIFRKHLTLHARSNNARLSKFSFALTNVRQYVCSCCPVWPGTINKIDSVHANSHIYDVQTWSRKCNAMRLIAALEELHGTARFRSVKLPAMLEEHFSFRRSSFPVFSWLL